MSDDKLGDDELVDAILCTDCEDRFGEEDSTFVFQPTPRSKLKWECPRCRSENIVMKLVQAVEEDEEELECCIICQGPTILNDFLNFSVKPKLIGSGCETGVYVSINHEHHGAVHHMCLQVFYEKYVKGHES